MSLYISLSVYNPVTFYFLLQASTGILTCIFACALLFVNPDKVSGDGDRLSGGTSPNRFPNANIRPTHLETMTTESLTLAKTISSDPSCAHDGPTDRCSRIDSLDSLLEDLDAGDEEEKPVEEEVVAVGASRKIPDELLHTNLTTGLSESEVGQRRRVYGLNQMKEENRSHIKQFLSFFVGPIQFVMEVTMSIIRLVFHRELTPVPLGSLYSGSLLKGLG